MLEFIIFFILFLFAVIVLSIVVLAISIIKDIDRSMSVKNKYDKYFKNNYEEME